LDTSAIKKKWFPSSLRVCGSWNIAVMTRLESQSAAMEINYRFAGPKENFATWKK
jgi:hypothetical protein